MSSKLTEKQKKFCREFLKDFNGTQAAIRAGYSEDSAGSQAHDLLKKPEMQEYLQGMADKLTNKDEEQISKIICELQMIAFGDIKDFTCWDSENVTLVPSDILGEKTRIISEVSQHKTYSDTGGSNNIKFKLHDKLKAIELLGRYYKIFTDKLDLTSKGEKIEPIQVYLPQNKRGN